MKFKLVRHFVADDPPAALIERAAAVFTKSDGDIRETRVPGTRVDLARLTNGETNRANVLDQTLKTLLAGEISSGTKEALLRGGKVYGRWPGLKNDQLNEGRDLALTTDFRDVFGEVAARHLGAKNSPSLFPGYSLSQSKFKGFLS